MISEPMAQLPKVFSLSCCLNNSLLSLDGTLPLGAIYVLSLDLAHPSEHIYKGRKKVNSSYM